jgi:cell division topological specificity factor
MAFLDYFRKSPKPAAVAKDRLSVIVARERAATRGSGPDYLPALQQELLAVLAKYEIINLENVSVKLDRDGDFDVLELNIVLPEDGGTSTIRAAVGKKAVAAS